MSGLLGPEAIAWVAAEINARIAADRELNRELVWNHHTNDLGDACPYSGQPAPDDTTDDTPCPARCRASYPVDESWA
jgi:hypothetical protein